jgi:hypothetical protein
MPQQHRSRRALGGAAVALTLAAGGAPLSATAEEAGRWFGRAGLAVTSSRAVRQDDVPNHTASLTELDGVFFNGDDRPFLDKARYQIVAFADADASAFGYQIFTDRDGSKAFARYMVTAPGRVSAGGIFEFTGGTGRYRGITGGGEFRITWVTATTAWDELRGEYRIPDTALTTGPEASPPATGVGR